MVSDEDLQRAFDSIPVKTTLQRADDQVKVMMQGFLEREIQSAWLELGAEASSMRATYNRLLKAVENNFNQRFWHTGMEPRYLFTVSTGQVPSANLLLEELRKRGFVFEELGATLFCQLRDPPDPVPTEGDRRHLLKDADNRRYK
jgi:hypothetical protein